MDESIAFRDLTPEFVRLEGDGFRTVDTIAEAQGVMFQCPNCSHGGTIGAHRVVCWSRSRGVPDDRRPGPGRWTLEGTGLDDLTLGADPPSKQSSVKLDCWHGHVIGGRVKTSP